jgi:hypothetical protein
LAAVSIVYAGPAVQLALTYEIGLISI